MKPARIIQHGLTILFVLCILLSGCTPHSENVPKTGTPVFSTSQTPSTPVSASPVAYPTYTAGSAGCPEVLSKSLCQTPASLRTAYGVTPLIEQGYTGKGQTVVVMTSFSSPTLQRDMDFYDRYFHLPPITITQISPLHNPVPASSEDMQGWAAETTLDVQAVHALAPDASIVVLSSQVDETQGTAGLPEFRALLKYVMDHEPGSIISNSWAAFETTLKDAAGQAEIRQWDALLKQATTQYGITVLAGSGDAKRKENFPGDDPWVTGVGGSTLSRNGDQFSETEWYSSGGGFSAFFSEPSYQKLLPASVQNLLQNRRGMPDVACDADAGLVIYVNGSWGFAAGTSESTPLWAALVAIANQMAGHPLGFLNPALYKIGTSPEYLQDFHDIATPTDKGKPYARKDVIPGWDPATGLGTPNAVKLLPDLIAASR